MDLEDIMKFGVLALDYDGTVAREGVLDPEVRTRSRKLVREESWSSSPPAVFSLT